MRPRTARLAVSTIFFANGLVLANWIARIPDVKHRLSLGEGTLGLALLCAAVGALLAQVVTGWAINRAGSRVVTTVMVGLFFATVCLPGFAATPPLLMLALFVLGACNGSLDVAMNAQAAVVEQQHAQPIMASFHGLWSVGSLLGAILGGLAASQGMPVGLHLLGVAGASGSVAFVATRQLIPHGGTPSLEHPAVALPPRVLVPLGMIAFGALVCEGAIADWSAIYLREGLGSTPSVAATGYAAFALLMAVGRLTGDQLTLRLGAVRLVRGSGALVTVGIGFALLGHTVWFVIAGFGLIGAGVACLFPVVLSAAASTPGIAPGTAIASVATAGYTGLLVGPPLIGAVAEAVSLRGGLGMLGIFGLLIIWLGPALRGRQLGATDRSTSIVDGTVA